METKSKFITAYDIKSRIIGNPPADFFEFMSNRSKALSEELSIGTIRRFNGILGKLKKFTKRDKLFFDEINVKFIRDFQQFLVEELKNHNNTIHSNLKAIRKMISDAIDEELMPAEKNPFNKIKLKGKRPSENFFWMMNWKELKAWIWSMVPSSTIIETFTFSVPTLEAFGSPIC